MLSVATVLIVTSGILLFADAGYERECSLEQLNGRRAGVCGSRLVDLLRLICRSVYNKRSADCKNHFLRTFLVTVFDK